MFGEPIRFIRLTERGISMKINNIGSSGINPYQKSLNKIDTSNQAGKKTDKVEISSAAKEMQQTSQVEKERQAKVDQLKIQVQNGQYTIDPKAVAKSIVNFYKQNNNQ
jgi:negative regulator of flagellin synthesis FlgM